ncbi:hypothetical protein XELAEV_18037119mg [Xenopus laevis]|uniref:Uncharacterized protein n=1 Tax=Xenopus laevis TaxID=8355 RepID=A0A974CBQ8_XENLA|nr:hypothetical protein XELAEV_18037119mg [Xenopus laevis]
MVTISRKKCSASKNKPRTITPPSSKSNINNEALLQQLNEVPLYYDSSTHWPPHNPEFNVRKGMLNRFHSLVFD